MGIQGRTAATCFTSVRYCCFDYKDSFQLSRLMRKCYALVCTASVVERDGPPGHGLALCDAVAWALRSSSSAACIQDLLAVRNACIRWPQRRYLRTPPTGGARVCSSGSRCAPTARIDDCVRKLSSGAVDGRAYMLVIMLHDDRRFAPHDDRLLGLLARCNPVWHPIELLQLTPNKH